VTFYAATRQILAEVFGFWSSNVDEMILCRFLAGDQRIPQEDGLLPQELWVEDEAACLSDRYPLQLHPAVL
jgi:hypothetical protein